MTTTANGHTNTRTCPINTQMVTTNTRTCLINTRTVTTIPSTCC